MSDRADQVSVAITVRDEVRSIDDLLASLAAQSLVPGEVIVVDGGSTDGTLERLAAWRDCFPVPLLGLSRPGANIAQGRNAAIAAARGRIVAITDAGVHCEPDWLARLVAPLRDGESPVAPDVASGFFASDPRGPFEVALGATTLPALADIRADRFLPSSRSVAFLRAAWERAGGYPEWLDYCEDLVFDLRLRAGGARFVFVPDAVAHFRPRPSPGAFWRQYYRYARGDGKAGLFARRHAIRYATYLILAWFLLQGRRRRGLWPPTFLAAAAYLRRPYARLLSSPHFAALPPRDRFRATAWPPLIRLIGDLAKMCGYPAGLLWRVTNAEGGGRRAEGRG